MAVSKKIGLPLATFLVAGNMIGSGIFLLPTSLAAFGSSTLIAWIIGLLVALLIAGVLAYLTRVAPDAGGLCGFATVAFGRFAGFQSTSFYWTCCWIGNIAIALAAVGYLAKVLPWIDGPIHVAATVVALLWIAALLNIVGPRFACQVQSSALIVGLIPVALVAIAGWWRFDAEIFRAAWNVSGEPLHKNMPHAVLLVFWAFLGLESASLGTAVIDNPKRNVPLATLAGVAMASIVYIAATSAMMGIIPASELVHSTAPFADAAERLTGGRLGSIVGTLVAGFAFIKASGTLIGFVLVTAQTGKTAAEQGLFPRFFAHVDQREVPVVNLVGTTVLMTAATIATVSPTINEQFNKLIEMSVLLCLLSYMYACAAVWPLTAEHDRPYRWGAAAALLSCIWIIGMSGTLNLALTGGVIVLACVTYFLLPIGNAGRVDV